MAEQTGIEWCDSTFNPWIGCTKVGPGCDHCYAEALMDTRWHKVQWGGSGAARQRTSVSNWRQPLLWEREHEAFALAHDGRRRRVFCASLADVFDNEVNPAWRADLFALIEATPHLDWLLLTKRVGNVHSMMVDVAASLFWMDKLGTCHLPANVWLGATVVNQAEADRDVPKLLAVPAAKRFLSIEPMLGLVDARRWIAPHCERHPGRLDADGKCKVCEARGIWGLPIRRGLDWVIAGGESGPKARPAHPNWFRGLRDQCAAAGVPFLFKQWGEWLPAKEGRSITGKTLVLEGSAPSSDQPQWHAFPNWQRSARVGKKAAGRLLDGVTHDGFPA